MQKGPKMGVGFRAPGLPKITKNQKNPQSEPPDLQSDENLNSDL